MNGTEKLIVKMVATIVVIILCCIFLSFIGVALYYYTNRNVAVAPVKKQEKENTDPSGVLELVIPGQVPDKVTGSLDKDVIQLYGSEKFKKKIGSLKPGKYSFDKGGKYAKFNDDISSFKIDKDYVAYLYKDTNYKDLLGKTNKDTSSLKKFKNKISSILITKV
jgi:hypothetical protein